MCAYYARCATRPTLPTMPMGSRDLHFGQRCYVMGVVNVTPDSFSDGGDFFDRQAAIAHALELAEEGADILDIGGESTRPGAATVSAGEELDRVIPVIEAIRARTDAIISVDTSKAVVARHAVDAGAEIVNDISALGFDADMAATVAATDAALVLMHIRGTPRTMQKDIRYDDLIEDIKAYFIDRIEVARQAGVDESRIILDPGIGFGKTIDQNYRLLRELDAFFDLGRPILLGTSRKSFVGAVLGKPPTERVWGTAATIAGGILAGADIVRVHDVAQMVDVVRVTEAIAGMSDRISA